MAYDGSTGNLEEVGPDDFRISYTGPNGDTDYFVGDPDVDYGAGQAEYLVVWYGNDDDSPLVVDEYEIWGQRVKADGSLVADGFLRLSDMGGLGDSDFNAFDPAVTYNPEQNQWLVVWWGDDNASGLVEGEIEVFGQYLEHSGGSLVEIGPNDFRISYAGPDRDTDYAGGAPDVVHSSADGRYLVVWG